jgi:hypothetical protein
MSSVDFNGIASIASIETRTDGDRLTKRIIELIKSEIAKTETQQKLKCVVDPIVGHIYGMITPYATIFIVIIFLIMLFQAYTIYKLSMLQRSIS